jgi:hypothetical protein
MKKFSILWLLCAFVVLLVAPTMAQDAAEEETPMATFSDETGLFSLQYPADLIVMGRGIVERVGIPFPNVFLVSSPSLVTRVVTEVEPPHTPIEVGDWGIAVLFFPKMMFMQMGAAEDASLIDLATTWHGTFGPSSRFTFEPEMITLANGKEAVRFGSIGDDGAGGPPVEDNYLMLHEITDGVIAITTIISAVDGRTPEMEALHLAVTNSIEFTGTAEDVLAMMPTGQ